MEKFKAQIRIPKVFEKVKVGYLAVAGDFCLSSYYDHLKPILEWQEWRDNHEVKRREIFIRRKKIKKFANPKLDEGEKRE